MREQCTRSRRGRSRLGASLAGIALVAGVAATIWAGWHWIDERTYRTELARALKDMADGRPHQARQRLAGLARRRPGAGEAAYSLGQCEEKLGHPAAALEAWSSIGNDSPLFVQAGVARAWLLIHSGRLGPAEELLSSLPRLGPAGAAARAAYEHLLRLEGRNQEARALIVESWRGAADPAQVLKRLYILDDPALPLDYMKETLRRGDPKDDRVWLGHAGVAIWEGRFEDARRWLDACEKRRPDDRAVWLARLSLATASRDLEGAARAAGHLEASDFPPGEVRRLRAWFAGLRGDDEGERQTLLALVADEPGDTRAWARLADLALKAGRVPDAESYRKKQVETINLRERYTHLLMGEGPARHAAELARLAKDLGREVEARGWSLIDRCRAGIEPLEAEEPPPPGRTGGAPTLAASIGHLTTDGRGPVASRAGREAPIIPTFSDDADAVGLRFFHDNGHRAVTQPPPEAMCGGVALLDYDRDGWLDVFAVQAGPFPPTESARYDGDRLFRNRGDGTFEDVTGRSGIASFRRGYGHGVAVGDYDNDGRPDLFVTRWRTYSLYRNRGDGTFEDRTEGAGLGGDRDWPTSAVFADLDGDGDLDLYVCHYLSYDPSTPKRCRHEDVHDYCMPRDYAALPDHVFRNDGGRFADITTASGFVDPDGRGLGVVAANLDDDNKIDLFVANDMSANYLFRNLGGFRFEEIGQYAGVAAGADGLYRSGMGIACGDLDGDLRLDLAVTNFFGESTSFFRNVGDGLFVDHTAIVGLQAPSRPLLGFGAAFADPNNDGWLDLLTTNGHVLDGRPKIPLQMPLQLLVGQPGGRLTDVSDRAGPPFRRSHLGRGLAIGDLDNDGRLDAVILNQNEPLVFLHNRTDGAGHFVRFELEGSRSNRDAVGTRVTIACAGRRVMAERVGGGSYQSSHDPRLHFGLGPSQRVDAVEVRWPSGRIDHHGSLDADREYRLREGEPPHAVEGRAPGSNKDRRRS